MRWLLIACAIVLASRQAAAKIVIMEPPLVRACQTAKSWPLLMDCMKQHGLKGTIVRQIDGAKLLVVQSVEDNNGGEIEAWALYVASGTGWKLGGLLQNGGNLADSEVVRFERLTAGSRHGYRFDIATSQQSAVSLDQVTAQVSTLHQTQATFCSGATYSCMTVIPSCTQLVFGQAVLAFEGSIAVGDNQIQVTGIGTQPQSCSSVGTYTAMFQ